MKTTHDETTATDERPRQRRRPRGDGGLRQRHRKGCPRPRTGCQCVWWISYQHPDGRRIAESAHSSRKGDAERLLRTRVGAKTSGLAVIPHAERLSFHEASQAVIDDFTTNGKRSAVSARRRIDKHLRPFFSRYRLVGITTADVLSYIAHRQRQGIVAAKGPRKGERVADVSNAQINRELALLKRTFSLAVKSGRVAMRPHIPMLKESAARSGFFEAEQLARVIAHLPTAIQPVVRFAAITGWRVASEVLPLEWRQVDMRAGEVRLDAGTTKNGEGRVFPLTADLRALLTERWAEHERLKKAGHVTRHVFVRLVAKGRGGEKRPKPITSFGKAWKAACIAAGCPGRIPHDLRRTAVRDMDRRDVTRSVAMALVGHKTESIYRRYRIVDSADLHEAARKLDTPLPTAATR